MHGDLTKIFDFEGRTVRIAVADDGAPWWVLMDICRILDLPNVGQAASRLDPDERRDDITISDAIGRQQEVIGANESGLWSLVLTSRKVAARRLKKWLTSEVLPALRATGSYTMPGGKPAEEPPADTLPIPDWLDRAKLVDCCRLTRGREKADALWLMLGLPDPPVTAKPPTEQFDFWTRRPDHGADQHGAPEDVQAAA